MHTSGPESSQILIITICKGQHFSLTRVTAVDCQLHSNQASLNIDHGQGTILDAVGNTRMSKKFCLRSAHSRDNSIHNQHIKPKRIQDKKAPVAGREETVAGREKQEGLSARAWGSARACVVQTPGRKVTEVRGTKPRPHSGLVWPRLQGSREELVQGTGPNYEEH